jgi:hypothetical protein
VPHCECGEQGSNPGVNRWNNAEEKILNKEQGILNDEIGNAIMIK